MTSPPEKIIVHCPECGKDYEDWWRPSINLQLDNFDDDYLRQASTSTCPACRHTVNHSVLVVGKDGGWRVGDEGGAARS